MRKKRFPAAILVRMTSAMRADVVARAGFRRLSVADYVRMVLHEAAAVGGPEQLKKGKKR